jgi:hypothetical protein
MVESSYKIKTELVKDKPFITVEMSYKDRFFDDKYSLMGNLYEDKIPFCIIKNNKSLTLKEATFYNDNNINKSLFMENLSKIVNDYDFVEDFKKNHLENFTKDLCEFINKCNSSMISNNKFHEGYKDKLKGMAGINQANKNLR